MHGLDAYGMAPQERKNKVYYKNLEAGRSGKLPKTFGKRSWNNGHESMKLRTMRKRIEKPAEDFTNKYAKMLANVGRRG